MSSQRRDFTIIGLVQMFFFFFFFAFFFFFFFFFLLFFPMTSYSVNGHFNIPHRDYFMVQHSVKELFK